MSKFLFEIEGFAELQQKIMNLADDRSKKRELISVLRQVAASTVRVAKQNAPVSKRNANSSLKTKKTYMPGTLKKSIGVIVGKKGSAKDNPIVYVGPRVKGNYKGWYGHIVEYGHYVYRNASLKGKVSKKGRKRRVNERITRKKKGFANSYVLGQFYMQKTYQQTGGKVSDEATTKVAAFIQKKINKLSNS